LVEEEKIPCGGCGKIVAKEGLLELPFCEKCAVAAMNWGFNQWVKAGAPGAKKE